MHSDRLNRFSQHVFGKDFSALTEEEFARLNQAPGWLSAAYGASTLPTATGRTTVDGAVEMLRRFNDAYPRLQIAFARVQETSHQVTKGMLRLRDLLPEPDVDMLLFGSPEGSVREYKVLKKREGAADGPCITFDFPGDTQEGA